MVSGEKVCVLGNTYIPPYTDICQIVYPNAFANPAVIADMQSPRVFDVDTRLDYNAISYTCTECSQQPPLGSIEGK